MRMGGWEVVGGRGECGRGGVVKERDTHKPLRLM